MRYHQFPFDNHQWLMSWRLREHRKYVRLVPMEVIWPKGLATSGFDSPHFELLDCFEQPIADGFVREMHKTDPSTRYLHPVSGQWSHDCSDPATAYEKCPWRNKDIREEYLSQYSTKGNFSVRDGWTCGGHAIPAPTFKAVQEKNSKEIFRPLRDRVRKKNLKP